MQPPRVTVLIAHYNYERFLPECIESVKLQTYPNVSICFVDDRSTNQFSVSTLVDELIIGKNRFEEISQRYSKTSNGKDHCILLNENVGPSDARNIGIENTIDETDLYLILDADDAIYPDKILRLFQVAALDPAIGVVYGDYDILDLSTGLVRREFKEPFSKLRLNQECIVHSGALISKVALKAAKDEFGYYDREMKTCEDYDLWVRISEKFMIMHIAEPLTLVKVHKDNSTYTVSQDVWNKNWQRIVSKTRSRNDK